MPARASDVRARSPSPVVGSRTVARSVPTAHSSAPYAAIDNDDGTGGGYLLPLAVGLLGAVVVAFLAYSGLGSAEAAFLIIVVLGALLLLNPRAAIVGTSLFLAVQGDLRRVFLRDSGGGNDPVVLVAPAMAVLLAAVAYYQGRLNVRSPLSKLLLALMGIMVLQIFNPIQGGLAVGLGGVLFYVVPVLWYWIGQSWGSVHFTEKLLFWLVTPLGAAAAVFAIWQAMYGLPGYQMDWIRNLYGGLEAQMGSNLRPFSFFTSPAEFATYLTAAIVIPVAATFTRNFRPVCLLIPVMVLALFLSGCRGPMVMLLATSAVAWALLSRSRPMWVLRSGIAMVLAASGMAWTLTQVQGMELSGDVGALVTHQTNGLLNPEDEKKSSAGLHGQMVLTGITRGILNPVGRGLGSTTIAGSKFGGEVDTSEVDFSDVFLALGVPGGIVYLCLIYKTFGTAIRMWVQFRNPFSLIITALLIALLGRWLLGQAYSVSALIWFCIGSLDSVSQTLTSVVTRLVRRSAEVPLRTRASR